MEGQSIRLLRKGAEACLYRDSYLGFEVIRKQRDPKPYRPPELDKEIRVGRTLLEGRLLSDAKKSGVPTPAVFQVDIPAATLVMEYIEGTILRDSLELTSERGILASFRRLGQYVALLHNGELVHGDLTTSNVIVDGDNQLHIIDFGLGEYSPELEARGVDLHLLLRTLESSHSELTDACWRPFLEGYRHYFSGDFESVVIKVREIRRRGRYVEERLQR